MSHYVQVIDAPTMHSTTAHPLASAITCVQSSWMQVTRMKQRNFTETAKYIKSLEEKKTRQENACKCSYEGFHTRIIAPRTWHTARAMDSDEFWGRNRAGRGELINKMVVVIYCYRTPSLLETFFSKLTDSILSSRASPARVASRFSVSASDYYSRACRANWTMKLKYSRSRSESSRGHVRAGEKWSLLGESSEKVTWTHVYLHDSHVRNHLSCINTIVREAVSMMNERDLTNPRMQMNASRSAHRDTVSKVALDGARV